MASTYTPITLRGTVSAFSAISTYGEVDGTGLQNENQIFELTLSTIQPQNTGDGSTRESNVYNGIDIETGMWISDDSGNSILKIISIIDKSETEITCRVEDVDMLSYRLNNSNNVSTSATAFVFETNSEGEAILATTIGFLSGAVDSIQSRFQLNERDDRVKFTHDSTPNVDEGDVVTIDANGNLVKFGDGTAASTIKIGTVLEKLRGGKDIYIKPFNDIILGYKNPEELSATPGTTYYADPSVPGELTTVTNNNPIFLQLNQVAATEIIASNTNLPTSTDTVIINGITVFDGPGGDSAVNLSALVSLIDGLSAQTNVDASTYQAPAEVSSNDNTPVYTGSWGLNDVFIPIGIVGSTPTAFAEITLSDGNNSANVVFDAPDEVVNFGSDYDVMSPTAIKNKIAGVITANSLDLEVSLINLTSGNGQGILIQTTGSATGITITNVSNDAFGTPAAGSGSSTGIDTSASLGTAVLKLSRASGGEIIIEGSPVSGGYINQGGIVSSNSGRVPYLLMIEATGSGAPDGAETFDDLNQTANVTSTDGDFTGATISNTPYNDSNVQILVNGVNVNLGDGAKNQACYFSADGGSTARPIADIEQSDALYWNGSIAGYELDGLDEIDIIYEK